jgi:hypothetical protein
MAERSHKQSYIPTISWLEILIEGKLITACPIQGMIVGPLANLGAALIEAIHDHAAMIEARHTGLVSVAFMIEGIHRELVNFHTAALSQKK